MGSWSVYCGISQTTITSGQKCVVLPLRKGRSYPDKPYVPAAPPIFGKYDDYGGLEDVEDNEYIQLIENHFNCKIEEFSHFFTRGIHRPDECLKSLVENEEIKDCEFMFIDRAVYDFLIGYADEDNSFNLEMGNPAVLKLLGFEYIGEDTENKTYDPKRFKYCWRLQGKDFHSDGEWLHYGKEGIYRIQGSNNSSSLTKYVDLPEDKAWLTKATMAKLWSYLEKKDAKKYIFASIGYSSSDHLKELLETLSLRSDESLLGKIKENYSIYGQAFADLTNLIHNLYYFSQYLQPYEPYTTPQCGERKVALEIQSKFIEIQKSYLRQENIDRGEDEDG